MGDQANLMLITVRRVFQSTRLGNIAGCFVEEGQIQKGQKVDVYREDKLLGTGRVTTLRRFKDDVAVVREQSCASSSSAESL